MATNGLSGSKLPRKKTASTKIQDSAVPHFQGDDLMEKGTGDKGRLASIAAQPITGLTTATRHDLLAEAGIRVRRGRHISS